MLSHAALRIILFQCVILQFNVWSMDISPAYVQCISPMFRECYLRIPKMLKNRFAGFVWLLLQPLYGFIVAGSFWFHSVIYAFYVVFQLKLKTSFLDPCLLFVFNSDAENGYTVGVSGVLVDDNIFGGSKTLWTNSMRHWTDLRLVDEMCCLRRHL